MKRQMNYCACLTALSIFFLFASSTKAQDLISNPKLDRKVETFLHENSGSRYDMNVPETDGKLLHDLIIQNKYKSALEIGTSTGISTVWIAWALSKTGGKLVTIEIDKTRYRQAIKNFKQAGLLKYIDARLADAHKLVPELEGSFDFVFSDADKHWYKNYFLAVDPKLHVNGCYTTHNVSANKNNNKSYLDFLLQLPNYETTVNDDGAGMAISYKKATK